MELSVIIPTRGRPEKIVACVAALASQRTRREFEVLVGCDGEAPDVSGALLDAWRSRGRDGGALRVDEAPHAGPAATRNRVLARARGRIVLLLNDDVIPRADLIDAHAAAHDEPARARRPAMVLGAAPWRVHPDDRLFDRLVRETSLIFFYDRMTGPPADNPEHDWGFRHAWTLNLSLPAALLRDAGGFTSALPSPVYEDLEMAFRVAARSVPVLFRPGAVAQHDHRVTPDEYLRREYTLGYRAVGLARAAPACAAAVFGRDVLGEPERAYAAMYVEREHRAARDAQAILRDDAALPAHAGGKHAAMLVRALYQQHLPLKRWLWRAGLLDAHAGRAPDPEPLMRSLVN